MRTRVGRRRDFTTDEAARMLGLRRHTIVDLVNRGFLTPSVSRGRRGRGGGRLFDVCDLVVIRSAQELTRLGLVGRPLRVACLAIRKSERNGLGRALMVLTHLGEALNVAAGRELLRLLRHVERRFGHVVLDLQRVSREVRRAAQMR